MFVLYVKSSKRAKDVQQEKMNNFEFIYGSSVTADGVGCKLSLQDM